MSPNEPTPHPDAIQPDPRHITSEIPAPAREYDFKAAPTKPHPGFRWSVLWCLGFMIMTQMPGAILAVVIILVHAALHPEAAKALGSSEALLGSPVTNVAMATAFLVTEILVIGVSLVVIRLVVGRDWTRQVAVRRPALGHVGLVVASLPGLVVLANAIYAVLKKNLPVRMAEVMSVVREWPWAAAMLVLGISGLVVGLMAWRDRVRQGPGLQNLAASVVLTAASLFILLGVLAGSAAMLLRPDLPDLMTQMTTIFTAWPWPFGVLVIGLGPGLGEELWCRGFLGRGLVGRYGVVLGVIFSSFFFGLIHVDPCQGTMAMLMGLYLHFTYLVTRSLWIPVLLHFLNNSLAVVSGRLPFLETLEADPAKAPIHLFVSALALIGVVIWALYTSRARLAWRGVGELWLPAAAGVEYPPEDSGMTVVHPRPSAAAFGLTVLALAAFLVSCYVSMPPPGGGK